MLRKIRQNLLRTSNVVQQYIGREMRECTAERDEERIRTRTPCPDKLGLHTLRRYGAREINSFSVSIHLASEGRS